MDRIIRKLKNTSGVTILFALLAFMVAAMVSAVLVNAALTNTKRVSRTKDQNQQYLVVESAVKLLQGTISDCSVTFDCVETTTTSRQVDEGGKEETSEVSWAGPSNITVNADSGNAIITDAVTDGVQTCLTAGGTSTNTSSHKITIYEADGTTKAGEAAFSITTDYASNFKTAADPNSRFDIVITINSDSSTEYANAMVIKATGKCEETGSDISEGDFIAVESGTDEIKTELRTDTETHHYEITWGNFLVTKGVAPVTPAGT